MKILEDVAIDSAYAERVVDVYLPDSDSFGVYIFFHGGGLADGTQKSDVQFAKFFTKNNIAVVSAEYRKYPNAVFPQFIEDAAYAVHWVKENIRQYGDVTGMFVGGSSAGAYLTMMLYFNPEYLKKYDLTRNDFNGFIFDAGQPTTHFRVLKERGLPEYRVVIDDAAPLFYPEDAKVYPPIEIFVADNDIPCRYEQTLLLMKALEGAGYDMDKLSYHYMRGFTHCGYHTEIGYWEKLLEFIKKYKVL